MEAQNRRPLFHRKRARRKGQEPYQGDRFIPCRSKMNYPLAEEVLHNPSPLLKRDPANPSKDYYHRTMYEDLCGPANDTRLLKFDTKVDLKSMRYVPWDSMWRWVKNSPRKVEKPARVHNTVAVRVLDAPDVRCGGPMQLMDWSSTNNIAVALGAVVYTLNVETDSAEPVLDVGEYTYVTSLAWTRSGGHLAVGTTEGRLMVYDPGKEAVCSELTQHDNTQLTSMSWKDDSVLSAGDADGVIQHFDLRACSPSICSNKFHTNGITSLRWDNTGTDLASGGKDCSAAIWNLSGQEPKTVLDDHESSVRGLAWSPHSCYLLATASNKTVRFWNSATGTMIRAHQAPAKVNSLQWNRHKPEIVAAYGSMIHSLVVWKYPTMLQTQQMVGHERRILGTAISPDGCTVGSLSADETLRLWECFQKPGKEKTPLHMRRLCIR